MTAQANTIKALIAKLGEKQIRTEVRIMETAPCFRISRKEMRSGSEWVKGDTVMVFSGAPAQVALIEGDKDAGWAHVFAPTFRDGDSRALRGMHSKCMVVEFSAAEAVAAGIVWEEQ